MLLDKKIAQKFIADPTLAIPLDFFSEISEEAAELLAESHLYKLDLSGLTELTQPSAAHLGSFKGDLYLDGLKKITEASLLSLIDQSDRGVLSLDGLEDLPEIKRDLSDLQDLNTRVGELFLRGLRFTTYDSLEKVAGVVDVSLYLDSLECLPQQEGPLEYSAGMILNGLKRITKLDAQNLSSVYHLELNNLEEIDVECARLLADTTWPRDRLSIGLRRMSDEVASELVRSKCDDSFNMDSLEELSPFAAEVCGRDVFAPYVSFDGLQQISEEAFELLLADYSGQTEVWHPGSISLNGLKHLTPRMRNALEKTVHDVSLNGIKDGL